MKRVWLMALAACLGLLLAGAAMAAGPVQVLVVEQGQQFKVTLPANHTTGYRWVLASMPPAKVVKLLGSKYLPDKAETKNGVRRKGVGGREVWTFQAMGPGTTLISLYYVRTWEKGQPPAKIRELQVQVR